MLEILKNNRWVTYEEAELHYISESLGSLQKEGFLFAYDGPFTSWPPEYLDSVLAHIATKAAVAAQVHYEAKAGSNPTEQWSEDEQKNKREQTKKIIKGLAGLTNLSNRRKQK